ncbi:MAG: 50S ribosomal protein L18 [Desulfobacterales bacterium]|jgi:large subunit ribosomal protein L18
MGSTKTRKQARLKRKKRIRKKVEGTTQCPRLSVFRSARHVYAQIIDDSQGITVAAASTLETQLKKEVPKFENKVAAAGYVGKLIGERAIERGIKEVVFDRNGFLYHGRVKAVSEGAREVGLVF